MKVKIVMSSTSEKRLTIKNKKKIEIEYKLTTLPVISTHNKLLD